MLLGNKKSKGLLGYYILSSVITALLSLLAFIILGMFYKANNNTILVNVLVWVITILIAYCFFYFPYYGLCKLFKKNYGPLLNGYAVVSGILSILFYCLGNSYFIDDYSYTVVLGFFAGIITLVQISADIAKHIKSKTKE